MAGIVSVVAGWFHAQAIGTDTRPVSDEESTIAALRHAYDSLPYRLNEARPSGGFAYKPLRIVHRSAAEKNKLLPLIVAAAERPASGASHTLRDAQHILARKPNLDETSESVEASDRCAADYEHWRATGKERSLFLATAQCLRSQDSPPTPELAWNRALVIEALGLRQEARASWREYLDIDPSSDWADEARSRLSQVETATASEAWQSAKALAETATGARRATAFADLARQFPDRARDLAERGLTLGWAEAVVAADSARASSTLAAIEGIGSSLLVDRSEHLLSDFVNRANSTRDVVAFARLHLRFSEISEARRRGGNDAAIPLLISIGEALRNADSPFWILLSIQTAYARFDGAQHEECLRDLAETEAAIDPHVYPFEYARLQWIAGLAHISIGHVHDALSAYGNALDTYVRLGDQTQIGAVQILLAEQAAYVGNHELAWRLAHAALRNTVAYGEPSRATLVLDVLARELATAGEDEASTALYGFVIARTEDPGDEALRYLALTHRCQSNAALNRYREARSDCEAARSIWRTKMDATEQARLEAVIEIAEATATSVPADRLSRLNRAVAVSLLRADGFHLPSALRARALFQEKAGDLRAAQADLEQALEFIEKQRNGLANIDRI